MTDPLNLSALDVDGAIRDAAESAGFDRSDFLKKGALGAGGILAGGAIFGTFLSSAEAAISSKHRSKKNDGAILNFALTLEYLEAAFYKQAVANAAYGNSAALKVFAETVAAHEAAHVKFLKGALKSAAVRSPTFDFGKAVTDQATFAATAEVLEDTGVTAYLGQVGNILQIPVLKAAGTIATIEARHAAWIRDINGELPAPKSFDVPKSQAAVLKAVTGTGFIK